MSCSTTELMICRGAGFVLGGARERKRTRRLALRTEYTYLQWMRRYVKFHGRRHPRDMWTGGVRCWHRIALAHERDAGDQTSAASGGASVAEVRSVLAQLEGPCWRASIAMRQLKGLAVPRTCCSRALTRTSWARVRGASKVPWTGSGGCDSQSPASPAIP